MATNPRTAAEEALLESLVADVLAASATGQSRSVEAICGEHRDLVPIVRRMAAVASALPGATDVIGGRRDPLLGRRLDDRYRLTARLGAGAMGLVYAARDERLVRDVAIKVLDELFAGDAERVQRFGREARALAALDDPHIVAVHDLGLAATPPYLVMDRIVGFDLAALLRALREFVPAERLPKPDEVATAAAQLAGVERSVLDAPFAEPWPRFVAALGAQMAHAVAAAHGVGVLHRDIKPSNFMVDASGRLRLLDFGLARTERDPTLTGPGTPLGTPLYMAPEVLRGDDATTASDVWSLGATLYECFGLQPPFCGRGSRLDDAILFEEPRPLRQQRAGLHRDLEAICTAALAKNPANRRTTAADLELDLQRFWRGEPVRAQARPWPRPLRAGVAAWRRHRTLLRVVAVLAVLSLGTVVALNKLQRDVIAADALARDQELRSLRAALPPGLAIAGATVDRLMHPRRGEHLRALDRIVALDPDDAEARFLRLVCRAEETAPDAVALAADRTALEQQIGAERLRGLIDVIDLLRERNADAARARLIEFVPEPEAGDRLAWRLWLRTELTAGKLDRFEQLALAYEREHGRTALTWFAHGFWLRAKEQGLAASAHALEQSLALCPDDMNTLHTLAAVRRRFGRPDQALQSIEAALRLSPSPHLNYHEQHAIALRELGRYDDAATAIERFPADAGLRRMQAYAALRFNQFLNTGAAGLLDEAQQHNDAVFADPAATDGDRDRARRLRTKIAAMRLGNPAARAAVVIDELTDPNGSPLQPELIAILGRDLQQCDTWPPDLQQRVTKLLEAISTVARELEALRQ